MTVAVMLLKNEIVIMTTAVTDVLIKMEEQ